MASGFASVNRLEWGNSLHPSSYYSQCLHNSGGVVLFSEFFVSVYLSLTTCSLTGLEFWGSL